VVEVTHAAAEVRDRPGCHPETRDDLPEEAVNAACHFSAERTWLGGYRGQAEPGYRSGVTAAERQRAWEEWRSQLQQAAAETERLFGREVSRELRDLRRDLARLDRKLAP
jgi:hypothetical protein